MSTAVLARNKTQITHDVTAAVCRYLDERGFKPVETEVTVEDGWVADVASVISPTLTELIELKLHPRNPGYRHPDYKSWHDTAAMKRQLMTVLVEVKTSISDFRGDRKWTSESPTNLSYVAIPSDLAIRSNELPQGWGVLNYFSNSDCLRVSSVPAIKQVTIDKQLKTVHEIAVRRDHYTRHERTREFNRQIVDADNERKARLRMSTAMHVMLSIAKGQHSSVKESLEYHGVKYLPAGLIEEIQFFWEKLRKVSPSDK